MSTTNRHPRQDDAAVQAADYLARFISAIVLGVFGILRFVVVLVMVLSCRLYTFVSDPWVRFWVVFAFERTRVFVMEFVRVLHTNANADGM
jgi:hypothetical protein